MPDQTMTDLKNTNQNGYKAGFVAVMGRPNVGKSTLINALLGQTIAAVSSKPQTTRKRQLGILELENAQIIFTDTPGLHRPRHKLGEFMNNEASEALEGVDLCLLIVDASLPPHEEDRIAAGTILQASRALPAILALNKIDRITPEELEQRRPLYQTLLPKAQTVSLSALNLQGLDNLLEMILTALPEHPPYYPAEQVTDWYERDIAADLIRAAAMEHLQEELPHCIAVRIDEYRERGEGGAFIAATLFVERESQKGIVIGQSGRMLKRIGESARLAIEAMSGRKVYLELHVKVHKNWRNDARALKMLGYPLPSAKKRTFR